MKAQDLVRMTVLVIWLCCVNGVSAITNSEPLSPIPKIIEVEEAPSFFGTFEKKFSGTSDLFLDRFGPQTQIDWLGKEQSLNYRVGEKYTGTGVRYFQRSLTISLRESFVRVIDIDALRGGISDTFEGILGNPRESEFELVSPYYSVTERVWQEQVRESRFKYGLRPFTGSPYAYLSYIRNKDGELLYSLHARAYIRGLREDRLSFSLNLPLVNGFEAVSAVSFRPSHFGEKEYTEASLRLEKDLKKGKFFSAGISTDKNGWRVSAVLSKRL